MSSPTDSYALLNRQPTGVQAGQVVPHLHFHIIPRPPLDSPSAPKRKIKISDLMSSRGRRDDLDDEEAEQLVRVMRRRVAEEWGREFGDGDGGDVVHGGARENGGSKL